MATFVLMNTTTKKLFRKNCATAYYNTLRGAKTAATKLTKLTSIMFEAISYEEYEQKHNTLVEVTALLSGMKCMIPMNDRGTILDPSMESYYTF